MLPTHVQGELVVVMALHCSGEGMLIPVGRAGQLGGGETQRRHVHGHLSSQPKLGRVYGDEGWGVGDVR